jgi:GTPase SAR1 family protein
LTWWHMSVPIINGQLSYQTARDFYPPCIVLAFPYESTFSRPHLSPSLVCSLSQRKSNDSVWIDTANTIDLYSTSPILAVTNCLPYLLTAAVDCLVLVSRQPSFYDLITETLSHLVSYQSIVIQYWSAFAFYADGSHHHAPPTSLIAETVCVSMATKYMVTVA